jgi:hypothetical protein
LRLDFRSVQQRKTRARFPFCDDVAFSFHRKVSDAAKAGPTASTVPKASHPRMSGNLRGQKSFMWPSRISNRSGSLPLRERGRELHPLVAPDAARLANDAGIIVVLGTLCPATTAFDFQGLKLIDRGDLLKPALERTALEEVPECLCSLCETGRCRDRMPHA